MPDASAGGPANDHMLHLTIEIANSRGKYVPGVDTPSYDDHRGPRCYSLAPGEKAPQYPGGRPIQDGSSSPPAGPSLANSRPEQQLLSGLLAPQLAVAPSDVPTWSSLLVGPLHLGSDTIPVQQAAPALDLATLFNDFKRLFQALSPEDVNKLSFELIQVRRPRVATARTRRRRTSLHGGDGC
ncbi:hypothetical protein [Amycolatopsis sp. 3B14]|uniref:hypothetical protein n=1 Tax=Amycolatopsis sp. 3B14 TaxID=3243600 RepID=UPI003D97FF86